ncbi:hypothetical protein Q3G72_016719 [Acer saccharum]|nr:hypothetical protein Q3G72_016719 [Acer saccharum]
MPVVVSCFLDYDIVVGKEDAWVDYEALRNYEKKLQELRVQYIGKSTSDLQAQSQVVDTVLSNLVYFKSSSSLDLLELPPLSSTSASQDLPTNNPYLQRPQYDSANKTAQALMDCKREETLLFILANRRGKEDAWVDYKALRNYEKKLQELRVQNIDKSTSDLQALSQVVATLLCNVFALHLKIHQKNEERSIQSIALSHA